MTFLVASEARKNLFKLIDDVAISHEPAIIKGKRNSAVLICTEDWEEIKELLYVSSNKELSDSIIKGLKTPLSECVTKLD